MYRMEERADNLAMLDRLLLYSRWRRRSSRSGGFLQSIFFFGLNNRAGLFIILMNNRRISAEFLHDLLSFNTVFRKCSLLQNKILSKILTRVRPSASQSSPQRSSVTPIFCRQFLVFFYFLPLRIGQDQKWEMPIFHAWKGTFKFSVPNDRKFRFVDIRSRFKRNLAAGYPSRAKSIFGLPPPKAPIK